MHKTMEKLRDMLCEELEEYAKKDELSGTGLEVIHKITDTIKNIDKIEKLEGEDGYSERYYPYYDMYFDGGSSYARKRDMRGRYTRDSGRDGRMRTYSRDDSKSSMMKKLEEMLNMAENEKEREALNHCMDMLEKA